MPPPLVVLRGMSDDEKPSPPEGAPAPVPAASEPKLPPARKHMPTMLGVGEEASPAHLREEALAAEIAPPVSERKRQETGEWGTAPVGNREQGTGNRIAHNLQPATCNLP